MSKQQDNLTKQKQAHLCGSDDSGQQVALTSFSVADIREELAACSQTELTAFFEVHHHDHRKGVQQLCAQALKRHVRYQEELARTQALYDFQAELTHQAYPTRELKSVCVIGADEVGRGPLAGPLVVAAVCLEDDPIICGLNDSKKLSPAHREALAKEIHDHARAVGMAFIDPKEIDEHGMSFCLRKAVRSALCETKLDPDLFLMDGNPLRVHEREVALVQGDARVASIAAASIVAKVARDAYMVEQDALYPEYGFAQHKGYGSADHIAAIKSYGLTPLHRKSFCKNFIR